MTQQTDELLERRLEKRLLELRGEFETGRRRLGEIEAQAGALRDTLLRIAGAMQVLEEELKRKRASKAPDGMPASVRDPLDSGDELGQAAPSAIPSSGDEPDPDEAAASAIRSPGEALAPRRSTASNGANSSSGAQSG